MVVELRGNWLLGATTALTSLGFMLIGYDNGLMGGFVNGAPFLNSFNLNPNDPSTADTIGTIVSIYEIGCFIGSVATATFAEKLGRKKTIFIGAITMSIGAILQASAFTISHMIVGRIISGIGMGAINSTVPVLQAEVSPKFSRGRFVCCQLSLLNFGIFLAYWIDFGLSESNQSDFAWRFPTAFQLIFIFFILLLLLVVPESPRWLAYHDRIPEATSIISRLQNCELNDPKVIEQIQEIEDAVQIERISKVGKWKDLLKNDAIHSRKRLLLACFLQASQQIGFINGIIYYSNTLFQNSIGFSSHEAGLMSGYLQTWFFIASFIPWFLIDRIGRRPLLISCVSGMAAVLAIQSALIYQVQFNTISAHASGIAGAAMLFIFEGLFTIGFQATVWVYPSEILPLAIRQKGSSLSTASNWIFNFMIVKITPIAIQNIGWKTYVIFAIFNAAFVPVYILYFPETKGKSLEEIDLLFIRKGTTAATLVDEKQKAGHFDHHDVQHGKDTENSSA